MQKYLILEGGISSAHLLGWILILAQVQGERGACQERRGVFSIHFSGPSSALGVVQSSNLTKL